MRKKGTHLGFFSGVVATTAAALAFASPAGASVTCDRVASPTGSDSAAGTVAAPFKTGQKLASSLSSGETGCFRAGTFSGSISVRVPNVTLTSYPGERATLVGYFAVTFQGTGDTVKNLNIDGRPAIATPQISADNVTFSGNDVTNHNTEICFTVGGAGYRPQNTVIENNNIHNCGKLPAQNGDHGIYIDDATGTIVRGNWIHNNADWGVHMYPNGDHSLVTGNIIDSNGNGVIFAGVGGQTSDYNTVEHNIITNSQLGYNAESYWGSGPVGVGNVARNNCIKGAADPYYATQNGSGIQSTQVGFTASSNLVVDPGYENAMSGDYRIPSDSPCAAILAGANVDPSMGQVDGDPANPPVQPPSSTGSADNGTPTSATVKKKRGKKRAKKKAHPAEAKARA
jgi:parallel beta-helix repeat protein